MMFIKNKDRKISRFSWIEYLAIFTSMAFFSALPGIMYGYDTGVFKVIWDYFFWYLLYWAILSGFFCIVTAREKYKAFDVPMNRLSKATKEVAEGDFSVYIKPIHTADKADYVDQMFHDFNKMVKELGSLETMKTDFVANVSHEIKTPIAIIQNYATLLKSPKLSILDRNNYTDTIITAAKSLNSLVSTMLMLNKLENQQIVLPPKPYDVCGQLADTIFRLDPLFEEKNLTLEIGLEDRAYIIADENLMDLVWRNLFSNAIKFSTAGGKLIIKQTSSSDEICVSIKDFGEGMSEDTKKHIFEKFYQGDTSHSKDGNGLGMALVQRVIEMMDGRIEVKSQLGKGTTFRIYLRASNHL